MADRQPTVGDWEIPHLLRHSPLDLLGPTTWAAADLIEQLWAAGDALANAMRSGGDTGRDRAIDAWDALRHRG